jgi:formylglycine-generating enzyme required for sulfatase activity
VNGRRTTHRTDLLNVGVLLVTVLGVACERPLPLLGPDNEDERRAIQAASSAVTRATNSAVESTAEPAARQVGKARADATADVARAIVVPEGASDMPCDKPPDGMKCIEGGWFWRGVDSDDHDCGQPGQPREGGPTTTPSHRVWVSTFYMDQTEVTNADYEACVDSGDCPDSGPRYLDFGAPEQPITGVSWFEAQTYCEAIGKRLPTEAEFEKAARGTHGDATPFGEAPLTCDQAIVRDDEGRSCGNPRRANRPYIGRVMPVGSRPAGRYGLYDIAGIAGEWVADWWSRDWEACGESCRGVDPRGPCDGADDCDGHRRRVVRGGSWYWRASHATGYHRRPHVPSNRPFHHFGFRCAMGGK